MTSTDVYAVIAEESSRVGEFYVHCREVGGSICVDVRGDTVVPIASMFKVLLGLEVADDFTTGRYCPDERILVEPAEHSLAGEGLTRFSDAAAVSRRDLLYLSLAWSDNTATDRLLRDVGVGRLAQRARSLELPTFEIVGSCRQLLQSAGEDLGYSSESSAEDADWRPPDDEADLVLERTTRASASDLARLAELTSLGLAATPAACATVLTAMSGQVWRTRLASVFAPHHWDLATKTGTLPPWRGEFGIATSGDASVAVAVVCRQRSARMDEASVDSAIGRVGYAAVQAVLQLTPGSSRGRK